MCVCVCVCKYVCIYMYIYMTPPRAAASQDEGGCRLRRLQPAEMCSGSEAGSYSRLTTCWGEGA